jgi:hypothetical protein
MWRVALAFIAAPGVAALFMAMAFPAYEGLPTFLERVWRTAQVYGVMGAYPAAIVLGLPAYFIVRRHVSAKPIGCMAVGFVVAALPWALLVVIGAGGSASIDGQRTVIDGHTTAYGWLKNAEFILTIGLFGAVGGLVFWAVAAAGYKSRPSSVEQ